VINKDLFKNIFREHWDDFKSQNPTFDDDRHNIAVQKMLGCGDENNGYTEYQCTACGGCSRRVAFTCKSGFCLSCGNVYSDKVVSHVSKQLHPGVTYRHIVLTIPEQLRKLFYKNRKSRELYSELMKVGHKCLEEVMTVVGKQSVKPGSVVVLHTHGRSGSYNPHLHVISTDGGINVETGKWVNLGYFPFEIIHKQWQYYLLTMVRRMFGKSQNNIIDKLWREYPKGFVANVSEGEAPQESRGLAKYLAKYIASPPISIKRILEYTGTHVTYWYKDHETRKRKTETVSVFKFIGRMVQHIVPKGFQRIRYYGLQATRSFKKWGVAIKEGLKKIGKVIKGAYQIIAFKNYRSRYMDSANKDPFMCDNCKSEMEVWKIWHPKYGLLYDLSTGGAHC
tara:strand:+ start:175 stop:1356 length:1182 start_codon:yes stop_codon:yes gene_type:complete